MLLPHVSTQRDVQILSELITITMELLFKHKKGNRNLWLQSFFYFLLIAAYICEWTQDPSSRRLACLSLPAELKQEEIAYQKLSLVVCKVMRAQHQEPQKGSMDVALRRKEMEVAAANMLPCFLSWHPCATCSCGTFFLRGNMPEWIWHQWG